LRLFAPVSCHENRGHSPRLQAAFRFASARAAAHHSLTCAAYSPSSSTVASAATSASASAAELTAFRSELGARFTSEQLQPFDTALQELKLDAMNRGVATADTREQDMLAAINGKSVHEALLLGWTARRNRLLREIASMTELLDHNLKLQQQTAAAETPESVTAHLQNVQDILALLRRDLTDTEHRLTDWGATLAGPAKLPRFRPM
jgi:hypothetical protein